MHTKKMIFATALLFLSQWVCASDKLVGVWELESAKYTNQKGEVVGEIKDGSVHSTKIITQKYFSFITQTKEGKFLSAGEGHYLLKGGDYEETVESVSEPKMLGKTYKFNCKFVKGVWIHTGMEDGIFIEEHWRKVE